MDNQELFTCKVLFTFMFIVLLQLTMAFFLVRFVFRLSLKHITNACLSALVIWIMTFFIVAIACLITAGSNIFNMNMSDFVKIIMIWVDIYHALLVACGAYISIH
jgi:hypothetical protein